MTTMLDVVLLNIVSFCGGVLSTFVFVFCCESKRLERIAHRSYVDNAMNHQHAVYPPVSPVIATAPPPHDVVNITLK
jgi:hypothetical protein